MGMVGTPFWLVVILSIQNSPLDPSASSCRDAFPYRPTAFLAFAAAFWLAFQPSGPGLNVECTAIILVGLMLAVCTAKIMSLMNKNTTSVLRAIADLPWP